MTEETPELTEKEVEVTAESLAQSIKDLCADSTKSDRNQTLSNHKATLRMYAQQERALTKNYGVTRVEKKDD
jgi:hypothetical protein